MSVQHELATAYVHVGVVQISVANLVVIALMLVVFVLALLLPFPRGHEVESKDDHDSH